MIKRIKKIFFITLPILIAGCATAQPNYIDGRYYMSGDSNCTYGRTDINGNLICFNSKQEQTGIRRPISEMQAKAWYDRQNIQSSYQAQPRQTFCNNVAGVILCNSY